MNGSSKPYGIIAEFVTAADIMHAAEKVRDALTGTIDGVEVVLKEPLAKTP